MNGSNNRTMELTAMNEQGVFTLIFRDDELLREFENMVSMFNRKQEELIVTEIGESPPEHGWISHRPNGGRGSPPLHVHPIYIVKTLRNDTGVVPYVH